MSSTYTGVNNFPGSITIPSDGDLATAASVNAALEALADRTINVQLFLNGGNSGAILVNPIFLGTIAIQSGSLIGDNSFLNISQPGETTRFIGPTVFTAGNTNTVAGTAIFTIAPGGQFIVQSGGSAAINGGATLTVNGTQDVFGKISLRSPGYIQFRVFALSPTPSSQTLTIFNGDEFFIDPTVSNMIFTMSDPTEDGWRVRFTVVNATNTTNTVNLARTDVTSIIPFGSALSAGLQNAVNHWVWVDIVSRGGRWECSATGKF